MVIRNSKTGRYALGAAGVSVALALLSFGSWLFRMDLRGLPFLGAPETNPSTAVLFILTALSFFCMLFTQGEDDPARARVFRLIGRGLAAVVGLAGLWQVLALSHVVSTPADLFLFRNDIEGNRLFTSRMSILAAVHFIILSGVLFNLENKRRTVCRMVEMAVLLCTPGIMISILAAVQNISCSGEEGLNLAISTNSAFAFLFIVLAILSSHMDGGLLAILSSDSLGAPMVRRVLPAAFLMPVLLGLLRYATEAGDHSLHHGGIAYMAVVYLLLFFCLTSWAAVVLLEIDSKHRMVESELHRQQTEIRILFDYIPAQVWFKDFNNNIIRANRRAAESLGLKVEDVEGVSCDVLNPKMSRLFFENDLEVLNTGIPLINMVERIPKLGGGQMIVQTNKVPYYSEAGEVIGLVVMVQDITEEEMAAAEGRQKTAFLDAQMNSSLDGLFLVDTNGQKCLQNRKASELLGLEEDPNSSQQLDGAAANMLKPEEFSEKVRYLYQHPAEILRDEIVMKNGTVLDRYTAPAMGSDGKYYGRIWSFRDITQRKKMEAQLVANEERFRSLFDNMLEGYAFCDLIHDENGNAIDYRYRKVNDAFLKHTGMENVEGRLVTEFFPEIHKNIPGQLERYSKVEQTGVPESFETYASPLDRWFLVSVYSQEKGSFVVIFSNITEQKKNAEALAEGQERLAMATSSANLGVWDWDILANKMLWNKKNYEIFGLDEEEENAFDPAVFEKCVHPEDIQKVFASTNEALLGGSNATYETDFRVIWPNGEVRSLKGHGMVKRDEKGLPTHMVGMNWDITELKETTALLSYERDLFKALLDHSPDHIYFKDEKSRFIRSSLAQARQFGVDSAEEMIGKTDFDFFSDDHARQAYLEEEEIIRSGRPMINRMEKETWLDGRPDSWVLTTKIPFRNKDGRVMGTFGISKDITELKRVEAELLRERARLQLIFDSIPVGVALCRHHPDGTEDRIINDAHLKICGLTREQDKEPGIYGKITHPEDAAALGSLYRNFENHTTDRIFSEKRYVKLNGETAWVVFYLQRHTYADGVYDHLTTVVDITERKRLEIQLSESQKMETVGKLTGGIAHEFNSILTGIIGQSEHLLAKLPRGSAQADEASTIIEAAGRATNLTRQLLAFGRKQVLRPQTLNLNYILDGMKAVIEHIMGITVSTRIIPMRGLQMVKADAGQIEQVILNMVMNARDAMPAGGQLTLETNHFWLPAGSVKKMPDMLPGNYVVLSIADTGNGIPQEMQPRLFEPFFTTKPTGQGSGLGLSTCYGIIKQSGGHISVNSVEGSRTVFKIFLPQIEEQTETKKIAPVPVQSMRGTETIFHVEEDPALRIMVGGLLRRLGYSVLSASSAAEALALQAEKRPGQIDLLLIDPTLSGKSSEELAEHFHEFYPALKVLLTPPSTASLPPLANDRKESYSLLRKPFTPGDLTSLLRQALDKTIL